MFDKQKKKYTYNEVFLWGLNNNVLGGAVLCKIPIFTFSNIPDDNLQNCVFVVQHLS